MSNTIHKAYKALKPDKRATHLKVEIYYSKGGINPFTSRNEKRGYYAQVSPVTLEERGGLTLETYTAFSGHKCLVKEASRKLGKKAEEAVVGGSMPVMGFLTEAVLAKNGLELADNQQL